MEIRIERTATPKAKPVDEAKLGFGSIFTDHMFLMNYDEGEGWHDPRIVPYGPIELEPCAMCLHYGQEVFEGLKAYRTQSGEIQLFRPDENFKRLNLSNERLCIPQVDEAFLVEALKELIKVEQDWVPHEVDTSLYIRPFIIATDAHLGVHPAHHYLLMIILSPVGPYYPEGLDPVKIYVETNYVRAVKGGTGMAKTAGNYSASLRSQQEAAEQEYTQVLWLDGIERKYIEEVGAMNIFFVIDGVAVTPALQGSILSGITRKSCIEIMRSWGMTVEERRISIDEVVKAYQDGKLNEVFGTGTAAVISPVGHLRYQDLVMTINDNQIGAVSQRLYNELTGIQWGRLPDPFGWVVPIQK